MSDLFPPCMEVGDIRRQEASGMSEESIALKNACRFIRGKCRSEEELPVGLERWESIVENTDQHKWITPEKYKQLTGKDWPEDGPVWVKYAPDRWVLYPYHVTDGIKNIIIIANEHGKPPADFIPED